MGTETAGKPQRLLYRHLSFPGDKTPARKLAPTGIIMLPAFFQFADQWLRHARGDRSDDGGSNGAFCPGQPSVENVAGLVHRF